MLVYSDADFVRKVAAFQKREAAAKLGSNNTAVAVMAPKQGGRAANGGSGSVRGGQTASKSPSPAPLTFKPNAFAHLQPAPTAPEPTGQSRATTFAERMGAIAADQRGEEFDPDTMVAGPAQKCRRVSGADLMRVARAMGQTA